MTTQHTPGPWHVTGDEHGTMITDNTGEQIALWPQQGGTVEQDANARLLAQAPAMLQALQRLTHPMADDDDLRDALDVIARATGQPVPDDENRPFWRCPDCGREYDDIDNGPCPADDCPSRDNVDDEGPEPPYAGYESEAQLRRMAEVRRLEALRAKGLIP